MKAIFEAFIRIWDSWKITWTQKISLAAAAKMKKLRSLSKVNVTLTMSLKPCLYKWGAPSRKKLKP